MSSPGPGLLVQLWHLTTLPVTLCALLCVFQGSAQPGHRSVVRAAHRGRLGLQCRLLCVFGSRPPDCVRGDSKPTEGQGARWQVIMALALLDLPVG